MGKPSGQHILSLVTFFNIPIHKFCQKFGKKCIKSSKNGKFCDFRLFRCQIEILSFKKQQFYSSKKPTGQRISAMLSVCNIRTHEVYRKFDKNCIKTLKVGEILVFCHFRCQFEVFFSLEISNYLFIEDYWTTISCLVERFQHLYLPYLSKK